MVVPTGIKVSPLGYQSFMALHAQVSCFKCCQFAFVFTLSPLKLITCNTQWLNSVLLPSLLKFWVLVFNCKNTEVSFRARAEGNLKIL